MKIPAYPAIRPLVLTDKEILDDCFRELQPQISELCFANLYLFRKAHQYTLSRVANSLVIFGCGYSGEPYSLPPIGGDAGETARRLLAKGHTLYGVDELFATTHLGTGDFLVSEDRDNFDYVYLRDELAQLPGNRFHKKKNRISYFTARHDSRVEKYGRQHLPAAMQLLEEWQRVNKAAAGSTLHHELEATAEALELADLLGLEGVVVLVEGKVAAFALGEQLNRDTVVCHFEKADPFIEGVSQLVNREYSRSLHADCTYINREQDLGEAGLRQAKISYHPAFMVKKFRARCRQQRS